MKIFQKNDFLMGTIILQKIYDADDESVLNEVSNRLKELEDWCSLYKEKSYINEINRNSGKSWVSVPEDVYEIIKSSVKYGELSGGKFDITMAPIIKSWGIFTENQKIPNDKEISEKLKLVNYKDILLNDKTKEVMLRRENQMIDIGGIAKGYFADIVKDIYIENGVKSAFINIGGNVITLGNKPNGDDFVIGITNPISKKQLATVSVKGKSVVTSGGYIRYFEKNDQKYNHIIDSNTGYPSDNDLIGATIVSDKSIDGDALSTIAFIVGLDESINMLNKLKGIDYVLITKQNQVVVSKSLKNKFVLTDKDFEII